MRFPTALVERGHGFAPEYDSYRPLETTCSSEARKERRNETEDDTEVVEVEAFPRVKVKVKFRCNFSTQNMKKGGVFWLFDEDMNVKGMQKKGIIT